MKSRIQLLLSIMLFAFVICINTTQAKEIDVISFVLTDEGNDNLIQRLINNGCTNLYEALVYLRNNMPGDAPLALTSKMDALLDTLNKNGGGEVFTASLSDFTGGNSPVGINADGTFIRADFSIYDYDGHEGFQRYKGKELFTYATSTASFIYMGSSETEDNTTINYKAFAVAWNGEADGVTDDGSRRDAMTISPNPATDYIVISEPSEGLSVRIYNTLGECVMDIVMNDETQGLASLQRVDISRLPVGAYYLRMSNMACKFNVVR